MTAKCWNRPHMDPCFGSSIVVLNFPVFWLDPCWKRHDLPISFNPTASFPQQQSACVSWFWVLPSCKMSFTVADSHCAAMQLCPPEPTEPRANLQNTACQEPEAAPEAARGSAHFGFFTDSNRNSSTTTVKGQINTPDTTQGCFCCSCSWETLTSTGASCSRYTKAEAEKLGPTHTSWFSWEK